MIAARRPRRHPTELAWLDPPDESGDPSGSNLKAVHNVMLVVIPGAPVAIGETVILLTLSLDPY